MRVGWRTFFHFFAGNGLTKANFGCILYDIGSEKGRCSPQKLQRSVWIRDVIYGAGLKKIEKIFGNAFDKAQKCAIVYITRLIRRSLSEWGVIIERAHGMDGVGSVEEVFFSKVFGNFSGNF
jgi:hypothetical protein